jgi:rhodanese-related sulfurtransferase
MRRLARGIFPVLLVLTLGSVMALSAGTRVFELKVDQARALMGELSGKSDFVILDVRTPPEFAEGRLAGAVNIDLQASDFDGRLARLDKSKTYLVYCRTGNRSRRAVHGMERMGIGTVYHMHEGVVGWQLKGYPLTKE